MSQEFRHRIALLFLTTAVSFGVGACMRRREKMGLDSHIPADISYHRSHDTMTPRGDQRHPSLHQGALATLHDILPPEIYPLTITGTTKGTACCASARGQTWRRSRRLRCSAFWGGSSILAQCSFAPNLCHNSARQSCDATGVSQHHSHRQWPKREMKSRLPLVSHRLSDPLTRVCVRAKARECVRGKDRAKHRRCQ